MEASLHGLESVDPREKADSAHRDHREKPSEPSAAVGNQQTNQRHRRRGHHRQKGPPGERAQDGPHQQHNQNAPEALQEELRRAASALPGILFEPTPFSLAGSVGWRLETSFGKGPADAFIRNTLEFAHQHRPRDGSMHMLLPEKIAWDALAKGWGVIHPFTDTISGEKSEYVMIFGPRDLRELKTIWTIAQISYYQARGISMEPRR